MSDPIDCDRSEETYKAATWGAEEPNMVLMSERTYWQLQLHFHPEIHLPRKMKKRLFGTRRRRRYDEKAIKRAFSRKTTISLQMRVEDIGPRYVPGSQL